MSDLLRSTRSPWIATPIVAIAVLLGFNGLNGMIVWGTWFKTVIALMAVVVVAISVTRVLSRSRILPTGVGLVAAVLASIPAFARGPEGQVRYLPTPAALRELATAVGEGVHDAATTVAPAEMTRPLLALVMCGALAIFLLAEHLAVSWRATAFSGLVLLAPWMPAIALQHRVSVRLLLGAIACWVTLLALTKRPTGAAARPSIVAALTAAAATVTLVALVVPATLGGNGWGLFPRLNTPEQFDTTSRLNLELDLRNSLTANSSSPILVYISTGERPEVFKLYTLSEFDGVAWSLDESEAAETSAEGVLWSNPLADWEEHPRDRVVVSVQDYVDSHLPLPTVPRSVDVPGSWTYSPTHDVVTSSVDTTQWLDYAFEADLRYFDAESLRSLGDAASEDALVGGGFVGIPESADAERFASLAAEVTAGATTRYDKVLAIQEYFRDPANFIYDTAVDPSGDDSVSVFLDDRRGYCVQFASAMIMTTRSLGIPSRLAIGFLPGKPGEDGASVVRGGDAHAWPEVYFQGAGWVRFEPTPSVQTGVRPTYADPTAVEDPDGVPVAPEPEPVPTGAPDPTSPAAPSPEPEPSAPSSSVPWLLVITLALAAVALITGFAWWLRRKRDDEERVATPDTVWERLRERLPAELTWRPSMTPYESVDHVVTTLAEEDVTLPDSVREDFEGLSEAVVSYRYAPEGTEPDDEELANTATGLVAAIAQARGLDARGRPLRAGARGGARRGA